MKLHNIIIYAAIVLCLAYIIFAKPSQTINHNGVTVHVKDTAEYFIHLNK